MKVSVIKEIQTARRCPSSLSPIDRRIVVAHIQVSLDQYCDQIAELCSDNSSSIARLVEAIGEKAPELASVDNGRFLTIMVGFERLFSTLDRMIALSARTSDSIN